MAAVARRLGAQRRRCAVLHDPAPTLRGHPPRHRSRAAAPAPRNLAAAAARRGRAIQGRPSRRAATRHGTAYRLAARRGPAGCTGGTARWACRRPCLPSCRRRRPGAAAAAPPRRAAGRGARAGRTLPAHTLRGRTAPHRHLPARLALCPRGAADLPAHLRLPARVTWRRAARWLPSAPVGGRGGDGHGRPAGLAQTQARRRTHAAARRPTRRPARAAAGRFGTNAGHPSRSTPRWDAHRCAVNGRTAFGRATTGGAAATGGAGVARCTAATWGSPAARRAGTARSAAAGSTARGADSAADGDATCRGSGSASAGAAAAALRAWRWTSSGAAVAVARVLSYGSSQKADACPWLGRVGPPSVASPRRSESDG